MACRKMSDKVGAEDVGSTEVRQLKITLVSRAKKLIFFHIKIKTTEGVFSVVLVF